MKRKPPPGFVAHVIVDRDEEFVLFEWDAEGASRLQTPLSPAEEEVLRLLRQGLSNAAIAEARRTSLRTIANQVATVLRKLGARSRYELMAAGPKR